VLDLFVELLAYIAHPKVPFSLGGRQDLLLI